MLLGKHLVDYPAAIRNGCLHVLIMSTSHLVASRVVGCVLEDKREISLCILVLHQEGKKVTIHG